MAILTDDTTEVSKVVIGSHGPPRVPPPTSKLTPTSQAAGFFRVLGTLNVRPSQTPENPFEPCIDMERSENNFQVSVTVIMVQFIRLRGEFWVGVRALLQRRAWSHRVAAACSAQGCPHGTKLRTAHYFSIRNLRLSKNFPPFGRRVAVRTLRKIKSNVD